MLGPPELHATSDYCYSAEPRRRQTSYESRQGRTEQVRVLLAWSYSAVVYLAIVVLTSPILQRPQPNPCFSKAA